MISPPRILKRGSGSSGDSNLAARTGGYDAAIGCYDTALAIDPALTAAWLAKGVALHNLGRYEEAIDCYDCALVLDPENAGAWSLKGTAFRDMGRPVEASECYTREGEIERGYVRG